MTSMSSKRQPGGVSRSIDFLRSALTKPAEPDSSAKSGALVDLSELLNVAFQQAAASDAECGYFVAELLAFLKKNRMCLDRDNKTFREIFPKLESARVATIKRSPLRRLVQSAVAQAQRRRFILGIAKRIPHSSLVIKKDKRVSDLPDLANTADVVEKWNETVVYPYLRSIEAELRKHPQIGTMKKALDQNGKFQVSRLKSLAKKALARIAAVPRSYYFDIS